MRDKALEPAYMFPTNKKEPGSHERAAGLKKKETFQIKTINSQVLETTFSYYHIKFSIFVKLTALHPFVGHRYLAGAEYQILPAYFEIFWQ